MNTASPFKITGACGKPIRTALGDLSSGWLLRSGHNRFARFTLPDAVPLIVLAAVFAFVSSGCAFDLVRVTQLPAAFSPVGAGTDSFVLVKEAKAKLGTGFPTVLRFGTVWRRIGAIAAGAVYATDDQIVKVEASNIHEARLVVSGGRLVGFYLPVEKTFAPLSDPLPLEMKSQP